MSCIAFAIGLIFATNAGNYWLDIFNDYSASINLLIIGILQFVVVAWVRKNYFEKYNFVFLDLRRGKMAFRNRLDDRRWEKKCRCQSLPCFLENLLDSPFARTHPLCSGFLYGRYYPVPSYLQSLGQGYRFELVSEQVVKILQVTGNGTMRQMITWSRNIVLPDQQ